MKVIEDIIKTRVSEVLGDKALPDLPGDYIQTDSLGEVLEKLVIIHIRMWMLEDAASLSETDEELAGIKRKIDTCFKVKRPMYVAAINRLIDGAITDGKSLVEESVKLYKSKDPR